MFAKVIMFVLLIASVLFIFLGFTIDKTYSTIAIPFFLVLAGVYVMSPQLNWWWYSKRPPELNNGLRQMLNHQSTFYQSLSIDGKERFRNRVALCIMAHDFMPMVMERIPEDLKCAVSANIVHLTFGQENFLLDEFAKVIIYPSNFPSPQFPKQFHSSEIYAEDGVMMFSAEHLLKGFLQPNLYYNSGLHEAIQVYLHLYPEKDYPELPDDIWEELQIISDFPEANIRAWIGLEEINTMAVSICHFLMFPQRFGEVLPALFKRFEKILGFDPIASHDSNKTVN